MRNTPWGRADGKEILADGIISYSTPSHGGIWLSPKRQAKLPPGITNFLRDLQWWEEDCDWAVPYVIFAADILAHGTAYKFAENLAHASDIVKKHYPAILAPA